MGTLRGCVLRCRNSIFLSNNTYPSGEYPSGSNIACMSRRLWAYHGSLRIRLDNLKFTRAGWNYPMDEPRAF